MSIELIFIRHSFTHSQYRYNIIISNNNSRQKLHLVAERLKRKWFYSIIKITNGSLARAMRAAACPRVHLIMST